MKVRRGVGGSSGQSTTSLLHNSQPKTYREGIDALHIEWIGRLVEKEQVGLLMRDDGEDDASLLTRRKLVHHLVLLVARATVPAEEGTDPLDGLLGHDLLLEEIQWGHRQVQLLLEVLSEAGDLEMHVALHLSLGRLEVASH